MCLFELIHAYCTPVLRILTGLLIERITHVMVPSTEGPVIPAVPVLLLVLCSADPREQRLLMLSGCWLNAARKREVSRPLRLCRLARACASKYSTL